MVFLLTIMVIAVSWQVFSRYLLGASSSFTEEIARYLLIWIGVLGGAYVSGQQEHIAIDVLHPKLKEKTRVRVRILINILVIAFCLLVLVIGGSNLVYVNYLMGQTSAALNIPLSAVYVVLPLSGLLIIVYKIIELLNPKKYLL